MNELTNLFLKEKSFEHYSDTAVLELLLDTAGVRGDTVSIVQSMFQAFGSLKGVLEARPDQLMKLPCVSKKTATLVSMVAPLARVWERANMDDGQRIRNTKDAAAFCKSLLMGERNEHFYIICLNAQCKVVGYKQISEGTLSECSAYPRSILEAALNFNAYSVILTHNHPGSLGASLYPSSEDINSTIQLQKVLRMVNILMLDHVIIGGSDFYSLAQHGDVDFLRR